MDPNFSVLLGQDKRDECKDNQKEEDKKVDSALVGGLVGGIIGGIVLLSLLFFFALPRYRLWMKTRKSESVSSFSPSFSSSIASKFTGEEMIEIERREGMEVNTVAGNFALRF